MPRSNRYIVPGHTYHITHRCHNKRFLLRFARDRTAYLDLLRQRTHELPVALLNYGVTSNHIHLLIKPDDHDSLSVFIQLIAGDMAQGYNSRKGRSGAFWEGRFHATMIEDGQHLWNCMKYIDLNMVRARVVPHPKEWKWTGYRELMGLRKRYRLIDMERVLALTGHPSLSSFQTNYQAALQDMLHRKALKREPCWTESLAVGNRSYLEKLQKQILNRWTFELAKTDEANGTYILRESKTPYVAFSAPNINPKAPFSPFLPI